MHCVSSYPAKFDEMNLNSIIFLKKKYNLNVGLSDHTDSTVIPFMANIIGANYIEKHFTLDKSLNGPDHKASIDEAQLKEIVYSIKSKKMENFDLKKYLAENKLLKENKYQIWGKISLLINQHISDKQVVKQLLDLIDDYGIESYGEGEDDTNQPEFY